MKSVPFVGSSRKCSAKIWTLARKMFPFLEGEKFNHFMA